MPYPQNLQMAKSVEQIVRDNGAIPATIALMDGQMKAGLSAADLERLAKEGYKAAKASRRDMAAILTTKKMAGTTVSTTMFIAQLAGIKIFATGGIGGVHRGAEETFDISADIFELARTKVAVICAGAKSILDIAKTLEVLETNGVPVLGYKTDAFPAFYLRDSGFPVDHNFETTKQISKMLKMQWQLNMGGVLIANPIPSEFEMDKLEIDKYISDAIKAADKKGISRKDLTPFLLKYIFEMSKGKSLKANIALVKNNAKLAAKIALAYSDKR
jgi:pseudouridine-5'-phosphate glycosidase